MSATAAARTTVTGPVTIVVLAKVPVPGRVKTRLCPPYTPDQAAALAAAALEDTLAAVLMTPGVGPPVLVLDGDPAALPATPGFAVRPQRGAGLDERIANAVVDIHHERGGPVLLVGMDTPQLTAEHLARPVALLASGAASVLGLAADGGYWAIGLQQPDASVVVGVPMSTASTGAYQLERLRTAGLAVEMLEVLVDVDDAASARAVADVAPTTRFARLLDRLATGAAA